MKPKAKFEQIALWVVATSRPDLTMLLRKDNLTDAEKTTLRNAGVNVDVPYTKGMILSIRPALSSLDQMSVVFHQAIADQEGVYPPPDCPDDNQISTLSALPNL